jgi:cytochrome c553
MSKAKANAVVDLMALVAFLALTTTGLVLRWPLPPGSGRLAVESGHPDRGVVLLWGLDRHQWGALHYWTAVVMAVILVVHLLLHYKWISHMIRGKRSEQDSLRPMLGLVGIGILLVATIAPLLATTQTVNRSEALVERGQPTEHLAPKHPGSTPYGLTLLEFSGLSGVPLGHLRQELNISDGVPDSETLTRLIHRGEVGPENVAETVQAYYVAGGPVTRSPAETKVDLYEANCLSCHGAQATRIPTLLELPANESLALLRAAQPADVHQPLKEASSAELKQYLDQVRARQSR